MDQIDSTATTSVDANCFENQCVHPGSCLDSSGLLVSMFSDGLSKGFGLKEW